jgi:hypothetical protein
MYLKNLFARIANKIRLRQRGEDSRIFMKHTKRANFSYTPRTNLLLLSEDLVQYSQILVFFTIEVTKSLCSTVVAKQSWIGIIGTPG